VVEVEDLAPGINIGQPVMNLQGDHIRVLRYQAGDSFPIDYASLFQQYDLTQVLSLGQPVHLDDVLPYRDGYCNHLERIEAMPQQAYDNLALTLLAVTECGLYFDPCSLNVLIHPNGQSFTTLDHFENVGPYANVLGMACSLLDTMYLDLDQHALDAFGRANATPLSQCPVLIPVRQSILKKIILAANNTGLPWPVEYCPVNAFGYRQRSWDLRYVFRVSGLPALTLP
jgi:hypothetical protein